MHKMLLQINDVYIKKTVDLFRPKLKKNVSTEPTVTTGMLAWA